MTYSTQPNPLWDSLLAKATIKAADPERQLEILSAYLQDLPDMATIASDLEQAQDRYWGLQRIAVVDQLAKIISRRRSVASPPSETLGELIGKLKDLEQAVRQCRVYGPEARERLVQDIKTAATFVEDRKREGNYQVTFKVLTASASKSPPQYRCLTINPETSFAEEYALKPSEVKIGPQSYTTKKTSYKLDLKLQPVIVLRLAAHNSDNSWETLKDFDLPDNPGPLATLGLPLSQRRDEARLEQILLYKAYKISIEFSELPDIPPLLWDAAERSATELTG